MRQQQAQQGYAYAPQPVVPPETYPRVMQTPYTVPMPVQPVGSVSPTFLPRSDESVWSRLGKNVAQGWLNSTGWHVFDYTRNVDLFGR